MCFLYFDFFLIKGVIKKINLNKLKYMKILLVNINAHTNYCANYICVFVYLYSVFTQCTALNSQHMYLLFVFGMMFVP